MKSDFLEKYWDAGNEDYACYEALVETGVEQMCVNRPQVLSEYLNVKAKKDQDSNNKRKRQRQPPLSSTTFQQMVTIAPQLPPIAAAQ